MLCGAAGPVPQQAEQVQRAASAINRGARYNRAVSISLPVPPLRPGQHALPPV